MYRVGAEDDADVPELVGALLRAIPALDMDLSAPLWPGMKTCCSSCLSCITGFHQIQERMEQQDCPVMGEAMMLQAVTRLQASLCTACIDLRNRAAGEAQLSMEGVLAFLEVLAVWRLLGDQGQPCDKCFPHEMQFLASSVSFVTASFMHHMR